MAEIHRGRHMAEIDGDFVVFLIGARFSLRHPIRTFRDLGGRKGGMKAMLDHLVAHPEKGLLGYTMGLPVIVQYWRSFDHLEAFARDTSDPHLATWRKYYRRDARHGQGAGESESPHEAIASSPACQPSHACCGCRTGAGLMFALRWKTLSGS